MLDSVFACPGKYGPGATFGGNLEAQQQEVISRFWPLQPEYLRTACSWSPRGNKSNNKVPPCCLHTVWEDARGTIIRVASSLNVGKLWGRALSPVRAKEQGEIKGWLLWNASSFVLPSAVISCLAGKKARENEWNESLDSLLAQGNVLLDLLCFDAY